MLLPIPKNPQLEKKEKKWNQIEGLLDHNDDILIDYARQFPNETNSAFDARKKYFLETFINKSRDLISAPVNSVFGQAIKNNFGSENSLLKDFSENVILGSNLLDLKTYMRDYVAIGLRAYGNTITVIDKPKIAPVSREDERNGLLPYLSNVRPQDVLNWYLDTDGDFLWFAYRKLYQDVWLNPFEERTPDNKEFHFLWTKTDLIVRDNQGNMNTDLSFKHNWGTVPIVWQTTFKTRPDDIIGNAAMEQTSNYIMTMNNLLNAGVHELYKHGGSLLLMPDDAITATNFTTDENGETIAKRQDKNGMFLYQGEIKPEYLVKQLEVDRMMQWAMFYAQEAADNERDLKSVAKKGTDGEMVQESGFAKVVDREPLTASLISLASSLETYAKKIYDKVSKIIKQQNDATFEFDKDFDLRSVQQKFEEIKAAQNASIGRMSPTMEKEMFKNVIGDITGDIDVQKTVTQEIDEAGTEEEMMDAQIGELVKKTVNGDFGKPKENTET